MKPQDRVASVDKFKAEIKMSLNSYVGYPDPNVQYGDVTVSLQDNLQYLLDGLVQEIATNRFYIHHLEEKIRNLETKNG